MLPTIRQVNRLFFSEPYKDTCCQGDLNTLAGYGIGMLRIENESGSSYFHAAVEQ